MRVKQQVSLFTILIGISMTMIAEEKIPYVTAVPVEKAILSEAISQQAVAADQVYIVKLDNTVIKDKKVGDEVDLVQIDFDNRDLVKGKVIKQFISKTIQTIIIKPLKKLNKKGVVQANLNLQSQEHIFKVPLNALRSASGLTGKLYFVDPLTSMVIESVVTVLGFEGANIIISGEQVSEQYWVIISGFHKVVPGKKVQLFPKPI